MYKNADEIDQLIYDLIQETAPAESQNPELSEQRQYYQLPVKHTQGGNLIDNENKPWIVGHFAPGQYLNPTHPQGHAGIDLKAPKGTPIYPIAPGVVLDTPIYAKGGNTVRIAHEDGKVVSYYAHLDSVNVSSGAEVNMGTVIGEMGDSGNAKGRGAHLHYEVKVDGVLIDPQKITGKPVGSLSRKAFFIKRFIDGLNKIGSKQDRKEKLRKLAENVGFERKQERAKDI